MRKQNSNNKVYESKQTDEFILIAGELSANVGLEAWGSEENPAIK